MKKAVMRKAILLIPNELPIPICPANNGVFTLEELREIVGGDIETVKPLRRWNGEEDFMIVNENGRSLGLLPNAIATLLYANDEVIVGNAIVLHLKMID